MLPPGSSSEMLHVLRALEAALSYTRAAVLAAHPELSPEAPGGTPPLKLDAAGWAAEEILNHLSALGDAVARYPLPALVAPKDRAA
jgi:hypothetical protein